MSNSSIVVSTPNFTTDVYRQKAIECTDLFCNVATSLRLDNKALYQQMWRFTNSSQAVQMTTSNVYNNGTVSIYAQGYTTGTYLKLINDFANYNFGLYVSQTTNTGNSNWARSDKIIGIMPCAIEGPAIDTYTNFQSGILMVPLTDGYYSHLAKHSDAQSDSQFINYYNLFKVYSYSGSNIAFIAVYGLSRSAIFSYAKNIADPTDVKPIILMSVYRGSLDTYSETTGLNIDPDSKYVDVYFNDNRFVSTSYNANINKFSTVIDRCILYKFTYKGYCCDNIFTYEGELPYEHFIYNNEEYVHMTRNIVIKLS